MFLCMLWLRMGEVGRDRLWAIWQDNAHYSRQTTLRWLIEYGVVYLWRTWKVVQDWDADLVIIR